MSYYALWIDHKDALIFTFTKDGVNEEKIASEKHVSHHTGNPDDKKDKGYDKFYHHIATKFQGAKEIMIMGPGEAKSEFKHHCENHHHKELANAIVGVEPMTSHPSKADILKKANTFFKTYHQWTKNY